MSTENLEVDLDLDQDLPTSPCPPKVTTTPPSGLSNLFNNNNKPLNAYIVTSKPLLLSTKSTENTHEFSPSSFSRSSAYFTASLPNSINNTENWDEDHSFNSTTPSPHYLSRTLSSSNYFDNQSDYEVILDDGTRQKRTVSLSTIQQITSRDQPTKAYSNYGTPSSTKKKNKKNTM